MRWILRIASVIFFGGMLSLSALADSLPKTAAPMNSESVKKIYSGNTLISKYYDIYFAADGSIKGIFGKPSTKALIQGSWSVSGNEICMYTFRSKEPNSFRDCYQYWQDGRRIIALWSVHSDGSTVDQNGGYSVGEDRNLKSGDLISARYSAAPAM
ncbi:DUF995 domain-containing protein [Methylocapsa sp. S129]|uniref:DUF995 domain-containing protein n=1 Tax=Methylocapsa sp. S129 TaxID=1641869 RepID=UPI00131E86A5|nr:DUF995 domain-containing protein [Methylocapsa sp. S129]